MTWLADTPSVADTLGDEYRPRPCPRYCDLAFRTEVALESEHFVVHMCPNCGQQLSVPRPGAFDREPEYGELPDLSDADEHDWRL